MYTKHPCLKLISLLLVITLLAGFLPLPVLADDPDPEYSLTGTSISDTEDSVNRVYDLAYRLSNDNPDSGKRTGGFTWDTEGKKRSWTYYNGIMMDACLMLNEEDFASYVNNFYGANITNQGKVDNTLASDNYYRANELDSIPPARALFDLLRDTSTPDRSADKYRRMIDYIYSVMQNFERAEGAGGNFKHKMNNANWATYQVALDGLYMAQPFFMELANALDDNILSSDDFQLYSGAEPSSDAIYSEVTERMRWIGDNLYDPETRLYSHGWGPGVGINGQYWLRAVGWYAAALADVISMLPDGEYEEEKSCLVEIEKRLFDGMMEYQDGETGMWYNVINYGPELSGSVSNNELETSGTALIAYAMMKSYVEGYLDDTYGEAGLRAFNGTVMNYLDGEGLRNVYISSGVETYPEGYLSKEYKTNEAKGVGPLMMAATYANAAAEIHAESVPSTPSFATYSLVLSGRIGVNFYMDLPGDIEQYENSYMAFFVNGKETDVYLNPEFQNRNNTAYGFTCDVNVLQMAEEITAVFHYGEGNAETIESTMSVVDYLTIIKENASQYESEVVDLASAIGDYGYYCQQYLNRIHNLEDRYAPMPDPDTPEYDFDDLKDATDSYKVTVQTGDSAIGKLSFALALDSGTALKIYFTTKHDFEGTPDVSVPDGEAFAAEWRDGRYVVVIDDLAAHQLADFYDVSIMADGECQLSISALSYVNMALKNSSDDDEKNAVASIYRYYEKAMAYKASV